MGNSTKFIVKDWTGNVLTFYGESDSFEDAWGKIYERFENLPEDEFDEQMEEFYVEEKNSLPASKGIRMPR